MNKNKIIAIVITVAVIIGLLILLVLSRKEDKKMDKYNIEISIKGYGLIEVELDRTAAPITVDNFVELVESGYYTGTTFHRIIEGFMMQGGQGSTKTQTIKGEFSANGYDNPIKHERGVISMARANDMNSASSQFFIMHQDYPSLDGKYAAFGHVTSGMDVVDKVVADAKPIDKNGSIATDEQPVIEYIKLK